MLKTVSTFRLGRGVVLHVARGSVLDFDPADGDAAPTAVVVGAIVNAANEEGLGGGGVDGAISRAGGETLWRDRVSLPLVEPGVRCRTGGAVVTGPGEYGALRVRYVVHAVGPAYWDYGGRPGGGGWDMDLTDTDADDDDDEAKGRGDDKEATEEEDGNDDDAGNDFSVPDGLLRSAYQASLDRCQENGITDVAFSLLSAGIFRGRRDIGTVLSIGVAGIRDWVKDTMREETGKLRSVTLCGFSAMETNLLVDACWKEIGTDPVTLPVLPSQGATRGKLVDRAGRAVKRYIARTPTKAEPSESPKHDTPSASNAVETNTKEELTSEADSGMEVVYVEPTETSIDSRQEECEEEPMMTSDEYKKERKSDLKVTSMDDAKGKRKGDS